MQCECAGDIGGGHVARGLHILQRPGFKGDFRKLRGVEPFVAVQVPVHHRIGHGQRGRRDHDFAGRRRRIFRVKRNRAADAIGAAVDGFQRGVGFENGVVHAFRVFEVERLRRGMDRRGQ